MTGSRRSTSGTCQWVRGAPPQLLRGRNVIWLTRENLDARKSLRGNPLAIVTRVGWTGLGTCGFLCSACAALVGEHSVDSRERRRALMEKKPFVQPTLKEEASLAEVTLQSSGGINT